MSRLSFRPRPLDIHKKLPVVKSIKEFEDDETHAVFTSTRNSRLLRVAADAGNEVRKLSVKKSSSEIPTPQYNVVDTYERDYTCTFSQPRSYLRGRGARSEIGDFVEYDLDNEDEDWLKDINCEKMILSPEKFEILLFKLEVLDHKTRERTGTIAPTYGSPVPVLLQLDVAVEALQAQLSVKLAVFSHVYNYWKRKRKQWQKPILRLVQPSPPVNNTNPYNVFRPREKAHRLHTRWVQRWENNVQSFEKLRQVRRNLDQAKAVLEALIKREEKKREIVETEVSLQRMQLMYKQEAQVVEDGQESEGFSSGSSDNDLTDSDEATVGYRRSSSAMAQKSPFIDNKFIAVPTAGRMKKNLKQTRLQYCWARKRDPNEPVFLFTTPLDQGRLAAVGIMHPPPLPVENGSAAHPCRLNGRMGRGGRIIFDRWGPPDHRLSQPNG